MRCYLCDEDLDTVKVSGKDICYVCYANPLEIAIAIKEELLELKNEEEEQDDKDTDSVT